MPKEKKPFHFQPAAKPFALAGVYDVWKADGKSAVTSFAIVTTNAAPSTARYHDRMPLVLEESQFDDWMGERALRSVRGAVEIGTAFGVQQGENIAAIERTRIETNRYAGAVGRLSAARRHANQSAPSPIVAAGLA